MAEEFLTRIVITAIFIIFIIGIIAIFFPQVFGGSCKTNQEFAVFGLVSRAESAYNPTYSSVRQLKIFDCTDKIELYSDRYRIIYKDGGVYDSNSKFYDQNLKKNLFPVNIDTATICKDTSKICSIPDASKKDTYKVVVSPRNLKFIS